MLYSYGQHDLEIGEYYSPVKSRAANVIQSCLVIIKIAAVICLKAVIGRVR
jgi:hypothetical protein